MLYHRNPSHTSDLSISIDNLGYRNSKITSNEVDMVILGDSMTMAVAAKQDLGELFRQQGISAINLSMDMYGPQHYRDSYQQYIIQPHIRHKFVLIFIYMGNDFYDAIKYENILKKNGNWLDYLGYVDESVSNVRPWIIGLGKGLLKHAASRYGGVKEIVFYLPYKTFRSSFFTWSPTIHENSEEWKYTKHAFDDIIQLSKKSSSKPIFFLLPASAMLYSQFEASFKKEAQMHQMTAALLKKYFASHHVSYVDLTPDLKIELLKQFLFPRDDDFHFNTAGVKKVFDLVFNTITPLLQRGAVEKNPDTRRPRSGD